MRPSVPGAVPARASSSPRMAIFTNEYVVQKVIRVRVTFVDGRSEPAVVAGCHLATDLAVLRAQAAARRTRSLPAA